VIGAEESIYNGAEWQELFIAAIIWPASPPLAAGAGRSNSSGTDRPDRTSNREALRISARGNISLPRTRMSLARHRPPAKVAMLNKERSRSEIAI
jgi:hypothetical protein